MKTASTILNLSFFLSCVLTAINAAANPQSWLVLDGQQQVQNYYLQPNDVERHRFDASPVFYEQESVENYYLQPDDIERRRIDTSPVFNEQELKTNWQPADDIGHNPIVASPVFSEQEQVENYYLQPNDNELNRFVASPVLDEQFQPDDIEGHRFDAVFNDQNLKKYLQPNHIGRNRFYDELNHNDPYLCTRSCTKQPKPRLCYYIFNVELYSTMGPACQNCSNENITDCYQRQCILADGVERSVVSINRMIPGPTIDVCYGDRIVVDVVNKLATSALTIHWHGMLQRSTPWMDGVPYVTQCPINPNSRFRYDFPADTNGTLFYHAHMAHLHANGVYGALIVQQSRREYDPNSMFYGVDVPSHIIQVSDWYHHPAEALFPGFHKDKTYIPERPDGYLINGYGSHNNSKVASTAQFHVQCGKKYRFRIIASTTSTCSFKFAIQNHSMSVIALDGYPCQPQNVSTLVMSSGQRTDVIIKLNEKQNCQNEAYLIVVKGMDRCDTLTDAQTAHLIYGDTTTVPIWPSTNLSAIYDNPPYLNNHELKCAGPDNVCADTLPPAEGFAGSKSQVDEAVKPDHIFILKPGIHSYTFDELFKNDHYNPFYVPNGTAGQFAATINNVSAILPPVPLLTQENEIPKDMRICHNASCKEGELFCRCLNILPVELNSKIEIQILRGVGVIPVHPIHLHGHHFTVITPDANDTIPSFRAQAGRLPTRQRVERDVVHAPLNGLVRIRFSANNPGYWILHCHFSLHLEGGMYVIFKVGNSRDFKPPPPSFPRCGDFRPPI